MTVRAHENDAITVIVWKSFNIFQDKWVFFFFFFSRQIAVERQIQTLISPVWIAEILSSAGPPFFYFTF